MIPFPKPQSDEFAISPEDAFIVRLCGIDPGTDKLGMSFLDMDVRTNTIVGVQAFTIHASRLSTQRAWIEEIRSARHMRLKALEDNVTRILRRLTPISVACESPFFNSLHPGAFEALVQAVCALSTALFRYDPWQAMVNIDPMTVKKVVGASYSAKKSAGKTREEKKREVQEALIVHPLLQVSGNQCLVTADEHAVDATAIALYLYLTYYKPKSNMYPIVPKEIAFNYPNIV